MATVNQNIENLKNLLNTAFHGGAWHGPSVLELTKGLSVKEASYSAGNVHNIAELLYHITSWRLFCVKKMQGDEAYNISDDKANWGNIGKIDQFELETLMMELTLSHDELIKELDTKTDAFLQEIVPGAEYNFNTLINGIIHHDLYHSGQIAILKKLATKNAKGGDDYLESSRYFEDDLEDDFI
ncbi:DinB family protein [Lacihabitans sp. LS3-19]|uniref:DinB family protein n=1 Tax=Lacihabitans sp. LS3-19 TaxID=2487335 RepID=UPI0020CD6BF2|nr:DinB family protein [Lacihabitans sp. LS3-19]MCP9769862.1 DinB family protein [Lacihabitans sp. LS3-19]